MVESPFQSAENLADDFLFIHELKPHMVGIGPFIPHEKTIFAKEKAGTLKETLFFLSLLRIMEKRVLLPATTALATIDSTGREKGILAGANVVMPNLSPVKIKKKYNGIITFISTVVFAVTLPFCLIGKSSTVFIIF